VCERCWSGGAFLRVQVCGHVLKRMERSADGPGRFTNVFVKGLDLETTEEELSKHFAEAGTITNASSCATTRATPRASGSSTSEDGGGGGIAVRRSSTAPSSVRMPTPAQMSLCHCHCLTLSCIVKAAVCIATAAVEVMLGGC